MVSQWFCFACGGGFSRFHLVFAFPASSSVLEPDLDLVLGHLKRGRDLGSPGAGQILVQVELFLQLQDLRGRELCPLAKVTAVRGSLWLLLH